MDVEKGRGTCVGGATKQTLHNIAVNGFAAEVVWVSTGGIGYRIYGEQEVWFPFSELLRVEKESGRMTGSSGLQGFLTVPHNSQCVRAGTTACVLPGSLTPVPHTEGAVVYTFKRDAHRPYQWFPHKVVVHFQSKLQQEEFVSNVEDGIAAWSTHRPRNVLVVINPMSGSQQAMKRYKSIVKPIFSLCGIQVEIMMSSPKGKESPVFVKLIDEMMATGGTKAHGAGTATDQHCSKQYASRTYDGILAMGGDGTFFELINDVDKIFSSSFMESGMPICPFRLGHLPSGSTDAVACSLHGSRSLFTAAMHVAIGDSMHMDALRVSIGAHSRRLVSCICTMGFMADVVALSDSMRFFGPFRYDILGAYVLFRNRSYRCKVRYKESLKPNMEGDDSSDEQSECQTDCRICRSASVSVSSIVSLQEAERKEWVEVEDEYMSIMIMNQACISEKSPTGMYWYGHLCNGESTLVLVKKCSWIQYLVFLKCLSDHGLRDMDRLGSCPVKIVHVSDVEVEPILAHPSDPYPYWNLDGELIKGDDILRAQSAYAAIPVFARGVER